MANALDLFLVGKHFAGFQRCTVHMITLNYGLWHGKHRLHKGIGSLTTRSLLTSG